MIGVWRPKITEFCPFYSFNPVYATHLISLLTFIVLMVLQILENLQQGKLAANLILFLVKDVESHQHKY